MNPTKKQPKAPKAPFVPTRPAIEHWDVFGRPAQPLFVVCYGGGVASPAVLINRWRQTLRPDVILFANTGGEKPETYDYIHDVMQPWLASVGFPPVTIVKYASKHQSLEAECRTLGTMPSQAF